MEKWGQRGQRGGERKREAGPTEMVTCLAWVAGRKRARQVDIITTTSLLQCILILISFFSPIFPCFLFIRIFPRAFVLVRDFEKKYFILFYN